MSQLPTQLSALQQQLESELLIIITELTELTGLSSQWSGKVEVVQERNRAFGGKTFNCMIRIRADIAATELRWPVLLHEVLHCFSVERNADASLTYPGYEEGVVEQLQRLFRPSVLERLGVKVDTATFIDRDKHSAYTDYIAALEAMRELLDAEPLPFYLQLLGTPLEQRWAELRDQIQQTQEWRSADTRRKWRDWERILEEGV